VELTVVDVGSRVSDSRVRIMICWSAGKLPSYESLLAALVVRSCHGLANITVGQHLPHLTFNVTFELHEHSKPGGHRQLHDPMPKLHNFTLRTTNGFGEATTNRF
jgi:hypothetical protein